MAMTRILHLNKVGDRVEWVGWKTAGPLTDWRTDAPESLPRCIQCGTSIQVGRQYALALPNRVSCLPCAGARRPSSSPAAEQSPFMSAAARRFGGRRV